METEEQKDEEQISLFPTTVSEEKLDEARRKSVFKQLFGSSKIFLTPCEKRPEEPNLRGSFIIQSRAADHYKNGNEAMQKRQYEKSVICFSKAINLQPEQTQLYVGQAEAYLQLCDFQSAAVCYKKVWLLDPGAFRDRLASIYYVQGQCLFDRGLFLEALEAFSKAAEVKPGCRIYEVRSLACLAAAGHYNDCLKLVNDWMSSDGPTSDLYIVRARLHKQLHQTSQCYRDVKLALALNPTCPAAKALLVQLQKDSEQARQRAVDRSLTGQLPEALSMINTALENCPRDGHLYLFRGILYRRLKDFTAAIEDLVQAVELSEKEGVIGQTGASLEKEVVSQLVLTYNDFAVQCFSRGLYAEATLLLNKAIEEDKSKAGLYLNRGDCFFKQGEWCFALADYQQAEEMMAPDEPAVRLRLAVLHNTMGSLSFQDGCFREAVDMFSQAILYNPREAQYYENRSKAFQKIPNTEGARQDFICLLILDPTNEELPPMLMSLFPGCSMTNVLSSPMGHEVRVRLMDSIQACSSSSEQQQRRLNEQLQDITLTDGRSDDKADQEPELFGNQPEVQIIVKDLLQVKEAATLFFCPNERQAELPAPPEPEPEPEPSAEWTRASQSSDVKDGSRSAATEDSRPLASTSKKQL